MDAPETITNASQSQFSIARYSGGCRVDGTEYKYDPDTDTLVRLDVWEKDEKLKVAELKREKEKWEGIREEMKKSGGLF